MKEAYSLLKPVPLSGDLQKDIHAFLVTNGREDTASHCMAVGAEARRLAEAADCDPAQAEQAGWLHDIGAVYPNDVRIEAARLLNLDVLPEEEAFPMIVHQKLSRQMGHDLFGIRDAAVLDAAGCHTTLRPCSTLLDRAVFVADKIKWDQTGEPPYLNLLLPSLELSVTHAAFAYLSYMWDQRDKLRVVHPWLRSSYLELSAHLS
ncbi:MULTISPECIES: HD domain-containing protein [unclassified Paenibacillus]|uniref:HD domain-containing protein n=1 Tax=unclassified Paenibacillus TaxID=185978 RepID=UPI0009552CF6|nr:MULTISPECIES: HD domain-containing protein [unclassified Paenibacillus]SIQ75700.1 putative HD superfamily hydrolase of NAD metabolism [Paenibacillus sp. RU4X]SIQ97149.1 putative HD superfamily hydrolase of NAD metabolism [Paenibacillus sp. RU4T]